MIITQILSLFTFSYDVREGPAAHWRNSHYLGARAVFYAPTHALHAPTHALHASTHAFNAPTNAYASYLRIQGVLGRDQGSYTCKVHFRASPTLTFTTNLTVVGELLSPSPLTGIIHHRHRRSHYLQNSAITVPTNVAHITKLSLTITTSLTTRYNLSLD